MPNFRIEGQTDLLKDPSKGSVINTDKTAYQRYMQSKNQNVKFQDAVSDINNLKAEVIEIAVISTEREFGTLDPKVVSGEIKKIK